MFQQFLRDHFIVYNQCFTVNIYEPNFDWVLRLQWLQPPEDEADCTKTVRVTML
jgi:hypothetical protein